MKHPRYPIRPNMDWRHYRTPRSIDGYYPEIPKTPGWIMAVTGAVIGLGLLVLVVAKCAN
jgi:hypothetical protein